ncbi:MAG TPA: hypothetical protein VE986_03365 [Hyphomicrobiales bacterium]|nr:hypothetical protein [Hyphomicrobiales bacterium]
MSGQFDASFVYTGAISPEVQAAHASEVEHTMFMPGKLAKAKLHANNELQRAVLACNRIVWGGMPADARQPAQSEIDALLKQLPPENRERLLKEAQLAAEARNLVALLSAAEVEAQARLEAQRAEQERAEAEERARIEAERAERARAEALNALRAEFDEIDAAGKEARFQAWLAGRR